MRQVNFIRVFGLVLAVALGETTASAQSLEAQLQPVPAETLASEARRLGDAARGAVIFHQQSMACVRCHRIGESDRDSIGPDLTTRGAIESDADLVESVLWPSRKIRKGFETVTVATTQGDVKSGRLVERGADVLVFRDASTGTIHRFRPDELETMKESKVSVMPPGQVNQLANRQQFLDLVRYLMEIRDGGVERARALQPAPSLLVLAVPEYEQRVDHAGLIGNWNAKSQRRGEAIYQRVCANCHGTVDQPGSLPTSLRFAEGRFKNGFDPYSMYRTLTHGFGMMTPQLWMVPVQKYDVIQYIREAYLRERNPSQYSVVDRAYLDRLPKGDTFGPEPSKFEPWSAMDYGPSLTHTYEVPGTKLNIAYKGVAVRIDPGAGGIARGNQWMLFETDTLRWAAGWQYDSSASRFIDWRGIQFNGEHQIHPRITGKTVFANSTGPGWANPADGSFEDRGRVTGRDGRLYGPLPKAWGRYRGLYHSGDTIVVSYDVGTTRVFERPSLLTQGTQSEPIFARTLWIGPRDKELELRVADAPEGSGPLRYALWGDAAACQWAKSDSELRLKIRAGQEPLAIIVGLASEASSPPRATEARFVEGIPVPTAPTAGKVEQFIVGGPAHWGQVLETQSNIGADTGAFAVDDLAAPSGNPWQAQMRLTGLDFFADGKLAACTWDGDVWIVDVPLSPASGTDAGPRRVKWKRIASGLFQPLGIKVVDGQIYVTCRDQIARLVDLNGDGEIDFDECFNHDQQVTEHFHEFAMGLQRDAEGNFYYAKSARHALKAIVPHHGTLLKVSPDGERTEIVANGFRAANGVCLNPDGSCFVSDQEGHWTPKNRINWVVPNPGGKPRFYGNLFGYTDVTDPSDSAMEQPLCWITNAFDRSPGEVLRVDSAKWGPLNGALLCLSYGYGKVCLILHEKVGGTMQGGMVALPIPLFPTGVMRGRFHPADGQLYLCGMYAWAGNAQFPGGLYRLRATGVAPSLPVELHPSHHGLRLAFTSQLDPASVRPENVHVKTWSLRRTAQYGSKHEDEADLEVTDVKLQSDGKQVELFIPKIAPTWCMEIRYQFRAADGTSAEGVIHNTIHSLGTDDGASPQRPSGPP